MSNSHLEILRDICTVDFVHGERAAHHLGHDKPDYARELINNVLDSMSYFCKELDVSPLLLTHFMYHINEGIKASYITDMYSNRSGHGQPPPMPR